MEDSVGNKDLEVKRSGGANDDVLSQSNDLQIAVSSSSTLTIDRSSGPGNETSFEQTGTVETDAKKSSEEIEEMPKLTETHEPEKSIKKFNLRKSLAWDSAFFTSDGVLDADELSTMIKGGDNGVKHYLPGIEEEVYRSMESISTLESDNLSLDCLEAELFQDIRASIQNSNRSSNVNNSSIKLSSGKIDSQPNISTSSKKADLDSGKRLGARKKDTSTSSIPPPKIISRVNVNKNSTSALTKRASLNANHVKKDQHTAKQSQVTQKGTQAAKTTQVSRVAGVIGPRRGVPKPLLSSKSSSSGTSTSLKMDPTRPSSSCSNSSSCSSVTDVKVRLSANISRKKVDAKTGKLTTTSIIPQTPSRINMKNKTTPVNSNLSSSISPASSISEWSSVSSSSTSTINQKSTSRGSIDTFRKGNQSGAAHPSQTGSVSRPPAVQPTGLRMPSPKIGFFDGGKSGSRTPSGGIRSQSKLPAGAPKPGATHVSQTSTNGIKCGKISPKTAAVATNIKPSPQKRAPRPSDQQQTSKPETKTYNVTSDASDHKNDLSLNLCISPSHNKDNDSYKQPDLGPNGYKVPSTECPSTECFVDVEGNKMDKLNIADGLRTPFAVKNSVSDTSGVEVTEKTVNFSFIDIQQNENTEVI